MARASLWRTDVAVREILVHLDSPEVVSDLLPAAAQLAHDLGASGLTLAALAEVPIPRGPISPTLGLLQARERDLLDLIDRMESRARAMEPGLRLEWRGAVSPVAQSLLNRWSVRADLVVMSSPLSGNQALSPVDVGVSILAAGRPVLVAPRRSPNLRLDRILVGFKPTREGRAALAGAVPLLERARRVLVVSVGPASVNDLRDAAAFLHGHGVTVETRALEEADDRDAGRVLLDLAAEDRSDLLVTGAYGRSRARELVFGGATRTLLSEARLPCLMVH
jgi:nucleotide-binding universal stress UspA family protein